MFLNLKKFILLAMMLGLTFSAYPAWDESGVSGTNTVATNTTATVANNAAINTVIGTMLDTGTAITSTATELNALDGITSTVTELNYTDGVTSAIQTQLDAKVATTLSSDWDAGSYEIKALTFESDQTTGTAPLTVASTTKVTNFNADLLDGSHASTTTGSAIIPIADASGYLPNDSVDTTALKTATASGTTGAGSTYRITLGGGEYAFFPRIYSASGSGFCTIVGNNGGDQSWPTGSLTTVIDIQSATAVNHLNRYITASGLDFWYFIRTNKITGEIDGSWFATDHPSYGNGGNSEKLPHPFMGWDLSDYEIVILDQETCISITQEAKEKEMVVAEFVNKNYKVNLTQEEVYVPLHSGKFLGQTPVLIETIPDYISVRKLTRLTTQEKETREMLREAHRIANEEKKEEKKQNRIKGINKLKALGLSKEEVTAMIGD